MPLWKIWTHQSEIQKESIELNPVSILKEIIPFDTKDVIWRSRYEDLASIVPTNQRQQSPRVYQNLIPAGPSRPDVLTSARIINIAIFPCY